MIPAQWSVLGQGLLHASTDAFLHGLTVGCLGASGVATAGFVLAALFLPAQPARPASLTAGEAGTAKEPANL